MQYLCDNFFSMTHRKLKIEELGRISVEQYANSDKLPLVIVLDNVRSQYNVGSIFRTSDAYRVQEIILCGICSQPPNVEIHKTALGAELSVPHRYFSKTTDAVKSLRNEGYTILAIEQAEQSIQLQDFVPRQDKKYAVILGHEVFGVQQDVIDLCDDCIELPQFGTKHSLNVSVTAGIVIWDFFKQIRNYNTFLH